MNLNHKSISRRDTLRTAAFTAAGAALSLTVGPRPARGQQPQAPQSLAELTRVATDVYMWRAQNHNTIFIVTDEGVLAVDPVGLTNPRSTQMYRAAIASVTDRPVRYLIYSHDHTDHITGGSIFSDTLQGVISHRLAAPKIAARNNPLTPVPTILVDTQATINLGGRSIDLIYTGRNHSDNSLVVFYEARSLMFAVDFIPVKALPFRTLDDSYLEEWLASLRWIEDNLFFDMLIPGHGRLGTKDDVRAMRGYFLDLQQAIRDARARGMADNSAEMVTSVRTAMMPRYGTWDNFGPYLPENMQGVIRMWREQGGG
jgi:glyoxylase-like metal-dependent hydrolase (beta-lactamase superfamily II)